MNKNAKDDAKFWVDGIKKIMIEKAKEMIQNPFYWKGYDSPVARFVVRYMYQYLKRGPFMEQATIWGYRDEFIRQIWEAAEEVTEKYCDAALQECIDYYNFPNKPVITRHRCPTCGSRHIMDDYDGCECLNCGRTWHPKIGRDLYLNINN